MKKECATSVGVCRTVRAAAIALVLFSPGYAVAQEPGDDTLSASTGDTNAPVTNRTGEEAKPADNTARNARDRDDDDTLTPGDQSNAESDVEITRSIRKMLVDDDSLGTNAENVKVITVDGMVTLRGPVANADEQARIEAIAKEAAGPHRVSSELEVIRD